MTPEQIKKLAALLSKLPSLGPRQATRLAFHIAGMPTTEVVDLAKTIAETAKLKRCTQCFRIDTLESGGPGRGGGFDDLGSSPAASRSQANSAIPNGSGEFVRQDAAQKTGRGTKSDSRGQALCTICSNPRRDQTVVAVVEKETDVLTLEKTRAFKGRYLVLGDLPKDGVLNAEHKRRLATLKGVALSEVIIAFSPTTYGDLNASVVSDVLKGSSQKITRLARGIPTGGEIEFADEDTLSAALKNRN